jgi:hypothetical protein
MAVGELAKPAGAWCAHCRPGHGCGIYETRPTECRTFVCRWLIDPGLADALRPDRIKVMLSGDELHEGIVARCDPAYPLAWRNEPIFGYLKRAARLFWAGERTVTVKAGQRTWLVTPAAEYDLGVVPAGTPIQVTKHADGTADVHASAPPLSVQAALIAGRKGQAPPRP